MNLSVSLQSKKVKLGACLMAAALAVVGLIRCVPGDQKVVADESVTDRLKEAEAAEEAEGKALRLAHGEDVTTTNRTGKKKAGRVPASKSPSLYIVQIGAFRMKENAEKLSQRLKSAGYPVLTHSMKHSKNGDLHLVRFEPTPNRAEAEQAIATLKSKESVGAQLLTVPAGT